MQNIWKIQNNLVAENALSIRNIQALINIINEDYRLELDIFSIILVKIYII